MRQLYLAATGQNRGKTTTSLGLMDGFIRRGLRAGFTKPVGQRTVIDEGVPADEDAVLMRAVFELPEPYQSMSPVHIPRGFTKAYIAGEVVEDLGSRIRRAHEVFRDHDVVLIEGTGHAGVGAVIGLSNAVVAALLGAPAVIVSEGGVGRPIDEIVLNASLFERHGVPVAGAIVNKVDVAAQPGIREILERGLAPYRIPLLGVLPVRSILSNPTLGMIEEGLDGELIHPGPDLERVIDGVAIGAMEPVHMLEWVGPGTLVIVPGDREDVITTVLRAHRTAERRGDDPRLGAPPEAAAGSPPPPLAAAQLALGLQARPPALGLVLTGGYRPRPALAAAIREADLFATLVSNDTYAVASEIHDLLVKTHPSDREKIEEIKQLVASNLDVDRILAVATEAVAA
ncbi:MAG TPA: AAA family ATPase [Candidatus Limnocylindrales bacterium]|nr:AAA family ATPase [Candidatus Limnocylindrales bacterium]